MNRVLQDTDTYSEILKGKNPQVTANANQYLSEHGRFTLPCLTIVEVVWGLQRLERTGRIAEVLWESANVEVLEVNAEIAALAGRIFGDLYRLGQQIGSMDTLIAATALHHDLTLVTGNTRHFERIAVLGYPIVLINWKSA